jgi:hypothetical protein
MLSKIPPGGISYNVAGGYGGIGIVYGPVTEPLYASGAMVAMVEQTDLDNFVKAGKYVWNAQFMTHTPVIMIVRRRE